jgi:hypothetical protein
MVNNIPYKRWYEVDYDNYFTVDYFMDMDIIPEFKERIIELRKKFNFPMRIYPPYICADCFELAPNISEELYLEFILLKNDIILFLMKKFPEKFMDFYDTKLQHLDNLAFCGRTTGVYISEYNYANKQVYHNIMNIAERLTDAYKLCEANKKMYTKTNDENIITYDYAFEKFLLNENEKIYNRLNCIELKKREYIYEKKIELEQILKKINILKKQQNYSHKKKIA